MAFIGGLVVIALLGAGAGYWWITGGAERFAGSPAPAQTVLPRSYQFILNYSLATADDRSQIKNLWDKANQSPSVTALLTGDPRLFIDDATVTQLFYVLLLGDTRPFILIPQTTSTKKSLAATADAVVTRYKGWYILHPLNTDAYLAALKRGTVNPSEQLAAASPLRLLLSPDALVAIRENILGRYANGGVIQSLALDASFTPDANVLSFSGQNQPASAGTENAAATVNDGLLAVIPDDANLIRLGANFSTDLKQYQEATPALKQDRLTSPDVSQLLQQLIVPYAFYSRVGNDGTPDLGLVLPLPAEASATATINNTAIEQAVPALLSLIMEAPPTTGLSFTDNTYGNIRHRFYNAVGHTITVDYALAKGYLLMATSKEGMFSLIDTLNQQQPSVKTGNHWKSLLTHFQPLPEPTAIVRSAALLQLAAPIRQFLPPGTAGDTLAVGMKFQTTNQTTAVTGQLVLQP